MMRILPASIPSNLPDEELLAAFVPYPVVKELVGEYGPVPKLLLNSCPDELARIRGIGPVKAKQLQYICELAKRLYQASVNLPPVIRGPQDVADRMADMRHLTHEEFRVILLNTKNGIIAEKIISIGTINAAIVSPLSVFHRAVKAMAVSMILVHNHPSGDASPSQEDIQLTKKLAEAGIVMDIAVLDHVIIGNGNHVSLKERGVL